MTQAVDKPIGVVIPAHGHPAFLAEAIVSACEQECRRPVMVVVVDDGCRFPETGHVAAALQTQYPGKLFYFRQENTRLPGARNAGVRFLLKLEPELDAIFFLDADNRLESYALESYRRSLGDDQAIGWAYPDITFFGLSWSDDGFEIRETAVEYSELKHLSGNISEAGSLVRADVFRKGVFFDETMRSGLEDWDFWFSALEAGYKGVRAEQSGFIYRRRPESMLSASQREVMGLQQRLRKKHSALFSPANILKLEQEEAPFFAIHIAGEETVRLTSDPLLEGEVLSLTVFKERLQAKLRDELEYFFPEYLLILSPDEAQKWQDLEKHLRWCFWLMKEVSPSICQVDLIAGGIVGYSYTDEVNESIPKALLVSQKELKAFVRQLTSFNADLCEPRNILTVDVPNAQWCKKKHKPTSNKVNLPDALCAMVDFLHEKKAWVQHQNRQYSGPAALIVRTKLINDICAEVGHKPYPVCHVTARDVFVFKADELEWKALSHAIRLMKECKDQGREVACLIEYGATGIPSQSFPVEWQELVSDIVYSNVSFDVHETRKYLGYSISHRLRVPEIETISVLLRRANTVFLVGGVACLEVAGAVRQYGTKVTVINTEDAGHLTGVTAKYLAYEHVIDHIIIDSSDTKNLLTAAGFPKGKISK